MPKRSVEKRKLTKSPIGDMRDRISLERRTTVPPDMGETEASMSFEVIAEVWAKVDAITTYQGAGDSSYNGVNTSKVPALKFTFRYQSVIYSSNTVVRWRDKLYAISDVSSPDERLEYTSIVSILRGNDTLEANQ